MSSSSLWIDIAYLHVLVLIGERLLSKHTQVCNTFPESKYISRLKWNFEKYTKCEFTFSEGINWFNKDFSVLDSQIASLNSRSIICETAPKNEWLCQVCVFSTIIKKGSKVQHNFWHSDSACFLIDTIPLHQHPLHYIQDTAFDVSTFTIVYVHMNVSKFWDSFFLQLYL